MQETLFKSFIMAGYECTSARAAGQRRLHLLKATGHRELCSGDYNLIKQLGIQTVREGFNWSRIERAKGLYDFSFYTPILECGRTQQIQQIWDLTHFDYPDFYNPFDPQFSVAYGDYAVACLKTIRSFQTGQIYIVPMNEISFFAWIGADKGWWAPYKHGRKNGRQLKLALAQAAMAAMDRIKALDDQVKFIQIDPFMRRQATEPSSKAARTHAADFNEVIRFEAWDILAGRVEPSLGGNESYLDIIGVNYYIHNQEWVHSVPGSRKIQHEMMAWDSSDRQSLTDMLKVLYERYQKPILISETGSFGEYRTDWWQRLLPQVDEARAAGIPIVGVCIYPTLDRPEAAGFLLPNSGIWDFDEGDESLKRIPHQPSIDVIHEYLKKAAH